MEIQADLVLQEDVGALKFNVPGPNVEVILRNGPVGESGKTEYLVGEVYGDSETFEDSAKQFRGYLAHALDCLCMLTSFRFQIIKVIRIVEWESGKKERQIRSMHTEDARFPPQLALHSGFAKSIEELSAMEMPPYLRRGLHCYRKAMITPIAADQFLEFWRALEVLAEGSKQPIRVRLKCLRCDGGFIACEGCGDKPERIPTPAAAMLDVLEFIKVPAADKFLSKLKICRNKLTHGSSEASVAKEIGQPLDEVIGDLSRAVWFGLKLLIPGATFTTGKIAVFPPSGKVVVGELIVSAVGTFTYDGHLEHPTNDQIPDLKTQVTWHAQPPISQPVTAS